MFFLPPDFVGARYDVIAYNFSNIIDFKWYVFLRRCEWKIEFYTMEMY